MELCRQFHCLPGQIMAEDASLIRYLKIEAMARSEEVPL